MLYLELSELDSNRRPVHGGGNYFNRYSHTVFDDDAQGYLGLHSQTNDIWALRVARAARPVVSRISNPATSDSRRSYAVEENTNDAGREWPDLHTTYTGALYWKAVSFGGCHPGDDGR